jgi:putative ABC transport system permease protein
MAFRYLLARRGVSTLTLASLILASALPSAVLQIRSRVERHFLQEGGGVDLVVGAKGSPLQLVLSAVHHLDQPPGNFPLTVYETLRGDPRIQQAVPFSLGDNAGGFRIVGTRPEIFDWRPRGREPQAWLRLREGRIFHETFDAVLGAEAAARLGLGLGDSFVGSHGLIAAPGTEHANFPYTVTGILEATGGAVDRLVFSTLESVWEVHSGETAPAFGQETREPGVPEITAIWLRLRSPGSRLWLRGEINRRPDVQAAVPVDELHRLYQRVLRPMERGMLWMAAAVGLVSGFSVLATLLQAADRRRRDWAALRMLGAHPGELLLLVWLEAFWLGTLGVLLGLLLSHGGLALISGWLSVEFLRGHPLFQLAEMEGTLLLILWIGSSLFGLLPALLTYRRSPAEDLSREA